MYISAKVDYALRVLLELAAAPPESPLKGEALATSQGLPVKFVENTLVELRRAGVVSSKRGSDGGYRLARPADEIAVADVFRILEGPLADVRGERPEDTVYEGPPNTCRRSGWQCAARFDSSWSRSRWPTSYPASCPPR